MGSTRHISIPPIFTVLLVFFLLGQIGLLTDPSHAQTPSEELLRRAIQQVETARYRDAVESLQGAIRGGLRERQITQVHQYLAYSDGPPES